MKKINGLVVNMKLDYKENFNEILKELRVKNNISQKELARKLNISLSTYSKYEQGLNNPTSENLFKISNFFNLSVGSFLKENIEHEKERINFDNYLKKNFSNTFESKDEIKEIVAYIKHSKDIKLNAIQRAILEILIYSNFDFLPFQQKESDFFNINNNNFSSECNITTENLLKILELLHYDLILSFKNYLDLISEK
jgi:toxin-antitoxin system, antitoxin component, xre family